MDILDAVEYRMNEEKLAFDEYLKSIPGHEDFDQDTIAKMRAAFYGGIEWNRTHQWYPCDGEVLPPYDMSVVVRILSPNGDYFGETFMHRSDNPEVVKDANGWALNRSGFIHTHWCYVPEFYN